MPIFTYKALPVKNMRSNQINRTPHRAWAGPGLLLAVAGLGLVSCDDLIEPNISDEQVSLLLPANASRSTTVVQNFKWTAVPNARTYRVQLATPSFAGMTRLALDTTVAQSSVSKALVPGRYEWRVQALNAGYETVFTTRTLTIDSTGSLMGQVLPLAQPAAGFATNAANVTFGWSQLPMAQQYRLWISPNPRGASLAALDSVVGTASTVMLRLARQSQTYQWKVTALNASSQTVSATQSFEIDLTPPAAPTLVAPTASASFLTLPIGLSWTRASSDVVQDSVFIYRANQTTLFTNFPRLSSGAALTLSSPSVPLISGTYYWAVRSMDKAGNLGPVSAKRAFVLQ
jgi:hypothetical protein